MRGHQKDLRSISQDPRRPSQKNQERNKLGTSQEAKSYQKKHPHKVDRRQNRVLGASLHNGISVLEDKGTGVVATLSTRMIRTV